MQNVLDSRKVLRYIVRVIVELVERKEAKNGNALERQRTEQTSR